MDWTRTTVEGGGVNPGNPSVDTISASHWVSSYYDYVTRTLKFAYTTDAGNVWFNSYAQTENAGLPGNIIAIDSDSYILAYQDRIDFDVEFTRTDDGGRTWTAPVTVASTGFLGQSITMCANSATSYVILYEDTSVPGDYRARFANSSDSGSTWTDAEIPSLSYYGATQEGSIVSGLDCPTATTWYWVAQVRIDGLERLSVVKTTNAGSTWTESNPLVDGLDDATIRGVSLKTGSATTPYVVVAFTPSPQAEDQDDRIVFTRSTDSGATWSTDVTIALLAGGGVFHFQFAVAQTETTNRLLLTYTRTDSLTPSNSIANFAQSDDAGVTWDTDALTGIFGITGDLDIADSTGSVYLITVRGVGGQRGVNVWKSNLPLVPPSATEVPLPAGAEAGNDAGRGINTFATNIGYSTTGGKFLFGLILVAVISGVSGMAVKTTKNGGAVLPIMVLMAILTILFNILVGLWIAWTQTVVIVLAAASFGALAGRFFTGGGEESTGDTKIMAGIISYFIALSILLMLSGNGPTFDWRPMDNVPSKTTTTATEQGAVENFFECSAGIIVNFTPIGLVINAFNSWQGISSLGDTCSTRTTSETWRSVQGFFAGLSNAVEAVFAAFNFMVAALNFLWRLLVTDLPGPVLLDVLGVYIPWGTLAFIIYRQIRSGGG